MTDIAPFDAYRMISAWNWTIIKLMAKSAKHLKYAVDHPEDTGDTASRQGLRANHAMTLEADVFDRDYAVYRDGKRDPRAKKYQKFLAENAGKTIITPNDYGHALNIARAVWTSPVARGMLTADGAETEVSFTWTDPSTGLQCKGLTDLWLPNGHSGSRRRAIADLKTVNSVDLRNINRMRRRLMWHGQLAHYAAGVEAVHGPAPTDVYIIAVEDKPPHDVGVFLLMDELMDVGRRMRDDFMARLAECIETGEYPPTYVAVEPLDPEDWELDEITEIEDYDMNDNEEGEDDGYPF